MFIYLDSMRIFKYGFAFIRLLRRFQRRRQEDGRSMTSTLESLLAEESLVTSIWQERNGYVLLFLLLYGHAFCKFWLSLAAISIIFGTSIHGVFLWGTVKELIFYSCRLGFHS